MIWRSLICSSLLVFSSIISSVSAASISGAITLKDSRVEAVRKKDFSGVVVYAEPAGGTAPASATRHSVMLQKNKMFTPHILAIVTGSTVDFPNGDPIFHNAFSSYNGQIFDVGLYAPGSSRSVRFARSGVVRVFCNIHPSMSSIILVLNTEYFTTTTRDGSFEIDAPPGEYEVKVFHERSTEQALTGLTRRVTVPRDGLKLPAVDVSEAGFLLTPHKNKYGKDYVAPPDDQIVYPGVRN